MILGETSPFDGEASIAAALEAFDRGYTPIAIRDGEKRPFGAGWQHVRWRSKEELTERFRAWQENGAHGVGLLLGDASSELVDVDLDHPLALRLRRNFLPPTPMRTGRAGRPRSHQWYRATGGLPATRQYKMPDGTTSVELRSDSGHQTVIPPTIHPTGEPYVWEGEDWGGDAGPLRIDGAKIALQVATVAMGAVLLENWPKKGGRHEAYLALAGGLLRYGHRGIHPVWKKFLPTFIDIFADATHDEDGGKTRVAEVMTTTQSRLMSADGKAVGWPKLAEIIGDAHADQVRRLAAEIEALSGWTGSPPTEPVLEDRIDVPAPHVVELGPSEPEPEDDDDPTGGWSAINLEPYLSDEIVLPEPTMLVREDGKGLMYPGRVNALYGSSESGKSWVALLLCKQEMAHGARVIYLDFEDTPEGTIKRMKRLSIPVDDITLQFKYLNPAGPLAQMSLGRYSRVPVVEGPAILHSAAFKNLLRGFDPTLIIADGMTSLYGLHGLSTNDASDTDVVSSWIKGLRRGGRTTVVTIDHTGKTGDSPIGAHHKKAVIQGTMLRVEVVDQPIPGEIGRMNLIVYKDRPGEVRKIAANRKSSDPVAGLVVIDSTDEDVTTMQIEGPDPNIVSADLSNVPESVLKGATKNNRLLTLMDEVMIVLRTYPALELVPSAELHERVGKHANTLREPLAKLVESGEIERVGKTRDVKYRATPPKAAD